MNVLVSVAISNNEEPSDHEDDDFLFEDTGEEDADWEAVKEGGVASRGS